MGLGTGIFLGCAIIALAILFLKTRETWKWKKIGLVAGALLVILPAFATLSLFLWQQWEDRPQRQTRLWDIALGDSEADVTFKKGKPTVFAGEKADPTRWNYVLNESGETVANVDAGGIVNEAYSIKFVNHRVRFVEKLFGNMPLIKNLGGVGGTSSVEEIVKVLGPPDNISRSPDEARRLYSFARYNVAFAFEKGVMDVEMVYNPALGPVRFDPEAK